MKQETSRMAIKWSNATVVTILTVFCESYDFDNGRRRYDAMTMPHVVVIVHHIVIHTSALIDVDHRQFSPAGKENENAATLMEVMVRGRERSWEIWQYTSDCRDKRAGMKGNIQLARDPTTECPCAFMANFHFRGKILSMKKAFYRRYHRGLPDLWIFPVNRLGTMKSQRGDLEIWKSAFWEDMTTDLTATCRFSIHFSDCERNAPMTSI